MRRKLIRGVLESRPKGDVVKGRFREGSMGVSSFGAAFGRRRTALSVSGQVGGAGGRRAGRQAGHCAGRPTNIGRGQARRQTTEATAPDRRRSWPRRFAGTTPAKTSAGGSAPRLGPHVGRNHKPTKFRRASACADDWHAASFTRQQICCLAVGGDNARERERGTQRAREGGRKGDRG